MFRQDQAKYNDMQVLQIAVCILHIHMKKLPVKSEEL